MTQIMNFKRMEVTGATKDEALAKAPFDIMGDATQAYKIWKKNQVNGVTDADKKQFMLDYLSKKSKNVAGVGFSITLESAVADSRERPYSIHDKKNESGARKYKTTYQLIDKTTGSVIAETNETKAKAKEIAKDFKQQNPKNPNKNTTKTNHQQHPHPKPKQAEYSPSKSSRVGSYLVFGVERG